MKNIFDTVPENLPDEQFEQLLESGSVRIERIISKGHRSPKSGWYDQEQNEWVIVLRGEAILSFEDGSSVTLNEVETIWLAVHY
jgi:cupin 2 domain-containing protein